MGKTASKKIKSEEKPHYVVGIGASAGGLEAINAFFENVPEDPGFSFVIIQHLSPDHKSLMAELLSKHTSMKVVEAGDNMPLKPNCVYLLPAKKLMLVKDNSLHLYEKEKAALPNNAIDVFFESLAKDLGPQAVGIILSGTGTDGTKGLQNILNAGGITIVQDPASAAFNGMPNSAIAAGLANMTLPPQNMASELIEFIKDPRMVKSLHLQVIKDENALKNIIGLVRKVGHDFSYYKNPTLVRRLSKRMSELNIPKLEDYFEYLNSHPAEIKTISQEFLINVTHFFRDKDAFDILRDKVIPSLLEGKKAGDTVKAWVIACSTGEEAYSVAMLFREEIEKRGIEGLNVKIFATDVDRDALEVASAGIYNRNIIDHISGQRIAKHFDIEGDRYRIKTELRKMVLFSHHDILKDPPFGKMDLITCRNFLIYIDSEIQKDILRKIHFALNLNGYLFVGPSEHIDAIKPSLEEVDKKWKIYRCNNKIRLYDHESFFSTLSRNSLINIPKVKNPLMHMGDLMKETLLEDEKYAGIYVDMNFEVKQAIGNYKNYLQFPESGFNFNLLKMANPDISVSLGSATRKAMRDNKAVVMRNVKVTSGKETRSVTIIVKPYLHHNDYHQQFLFIVLCDEEMRPNAGGTATNKEMDPDLNRVQQLESELKETRENLQAIIEEMEATNEELQSANEEMVSSNEELQSANEELQSLNEELHTVSSEHQIKIKELIELNDDLNNYFRNSDIGQILIDRNLVIRKFTPSATKMINLISSDINRSIIDITTRFKGVDFIGDIGRVLSSGKVIEKEITLNDTICIMKLTPYEKQGKIIDGVVISFIDVTSIRRLDSILEAVFKCVPSSILASQAVRNEKREIIDFEFVTCNEAAEKDLNLSRKDIIGKNLKTVFPQKHKDIFRAYATVVENCKPYNYDFFNEHTQKWGNVVLVKMLDGVVAVSTDITEKKKAADLVQQNYEELRQSLKFNRKKG
jgi:two-component system CheB/CheR fusion protein